MNVFARFDEIPDVKEAKRYGRTFVWTDNVKTLYPPTNTVCGGYKKSVEKLSGVTALTIMDYS